MVNYKIIPEVKNIKKQERKLNRRGILYKEYKTMYDFKKFKTARIFGDVIRSSYDRYH